MYTGYTDYTEYHEIIATMIQREWKKYILHKKIWCMLKPDNKISVERKSMENQAIHGAFERIHANPTHFKTCVITYNNDHFDTKKLFVNYKRNNVYTIYEDDDTKVFLLNRRQVVNKLNNIINVLSIKLETIVTDTNFYGYPELTYVKYF